VADFFARSNAGDFSLVIRIFIAIKHTKKKTNRLSMQTRQPFAVLKSLLQKQFKIKIWETQSMPVKGFLLVFAFFVFTFSVSAQATDDEAAKEKLRRENVLLEQILTDAKNLRLPENRAFVYAKIGHQLWQTDEKRARLLFQTAVNELIAAQTDAETEKGNKHFLNNLLYGQSPRWEILSVIANRDAEYALDAIVKTRPGKLASAMANYTGDNQLPSQQYARSELQNEQRITAQAADQNPQRAVKLLRESLKKDVTYETFNLLRKIFQKDSETANQLAEEVGRKLFDAKLDENHQDLSLIQNFLGEFGQEKSKENAAIVVPDGLMRNLADKIVKFTLRPNNRSFYNNDSALKVIEKYFPASVAQIKQKQEKLQNQNQSEPDRNYSKLMQSEVSSEELLRQADKFTASYRGEIYRRAAEKIAQTGNVSQAQSILTDNLPDEELDRYLSQFNYNLANQAISQGKYEEAVAFVNRISDENLRLNALISLATSVYHKNPKENQSRATAILEQARLLLPELTEKVAEMNALVTLASGYAQVESAQAFSLIESLTSPLNELSEASAVIAKYNDGGYFRQGEYQISQGNNSLPIYNLMNILQTLKAHDFERTVRFTNNFNRLDLRISLQMQLLQFGVSELPINGSRRNSIHFSRLR